MTTPRTTPSIIGMLRAVDAWLDSEVHPDYRAQPLAQDWARVAKVAEEGGEAVRALIAWTGQNPRKGVCGTREQLLEELADTACAALLGITHFTKDPGETWRRFLLALEKGYQRAGSAATLMAGREMNVREVSPVPGSELALALLAELVIRLGGSVYVPDEALSGAARRRLLSTRDAGSGGQTLTVRDA